jgi:hypothetical protein
MAEAGGDKDGIDARFHAVTDIILLLSLKIDHTMVVLTNMAQMAKLRQNIVW